MSSVCWGLNCRRANDPLTLAMHPQSYARIRISHLSVRLLLVSVREPARSFPQLFPRIVMKHLPSRTASCQNLKFYWMAETEGTDLTSEVYACQERVFRRL